jgi:hypothetical protein
MLFVTSRKSIAPKGRSYNSKAETMRRTSAMTTVHRMMM